MKKIILWCMAVLGILLVGIFSWMMLGEFDSRFSGKLEVVNTGCFADGECFVVIDSKHVTLLHGWSQETVGQIIGAPSIGDLESMIGQEFEVFAREIEYGNYTLYGNAEYYIKKL